MRRGHRHGQRPGELQCHGNAERYSTECQVEEQVHPSHREAVYHEAARLARRKPQSPRAPHGEQHDARKGQPQRRRAAHADEREQSLGKHGADLKADHGHDQNEHGQRNRIRLER